MPCALALLLIPALSAQEHPEKHAASTMQFQTGYCPQTHALEAEPQAEYWFEGTIGGRTARMYLDRGGRGVVASLYFTAGDWTPVLLGGEWDNGSIALSDATEEHPLTLRLQGKLTMDGFAGSWTSTGGGAALPVRLATVPEPKCDGSGPWKRFDSPQWPVSFSYPADWRLQQTGHSIALTCPNPRAMAYESDVTVDEGEGKPPARSGLTECSAGWRYGGSCECNHADDAACSVPTITHRDGVTILNLGDQEWRLYCRGGGYVGQGEGEDRVVLLQNSWIRFTGVGDPSAIIPRMAETAGPVGAGGQK